MRFSNLKMILNTELNKSKNAIRIGTNMHSLCEDYILGKEVITPTQSHLKLCLTSLRVLGYKKIRC